jgi:branched-chain amino acid transport system substrate-binding protein
MTITRTIARALLAAAALIGLAAGGAAAQDIKIGLIQTYTGPLASIGTDASNGFTLFFDEIGHKVAGRTVAITKEDDAANPAQAMERARRLVERDNVHLLTGITNSAVAYAMRDYVHGRQVPLVIMGAAGANGITNEQASPYIFRTSFSNRQFNAPFGPYACQKLGYKKAVVMASDFVTGKEQGGAFMETYKAAGCEVTKEIYAPLGTVDFLPFLSQIPQSGIDTVWAMFFGADAIAFVKQYDSLGFKAKYPLIGSAGLPDDRLLPAMGQSALGITVPSFYSYSVDTPGNKEFVGKFRAKFNMRPNSTAASGYVAGMMLKAAIEAVGGKIEDKEKFLDALRKVDLKASPMGPIKFDAKQNVIFDLHVVKVAPAEGTLLPQVVEKIGTGVDQFWQYKK